MGGGAGVTGGGVSEEEVERIVEEVVRGRIKMFDDEKNQQIAKLEEFVKGEIGKIKASGKKSEEGNVKDIKS